MRNPISLLILCLIVFASSVSRATDPSQIDFDKDSAFKFWLANGTESEPQYFWTNSFFDNGMPMAVSQLLRDTPNWRVVKLANYAYKVSFPIEQADLVFNQRPLSIKRIPTGAYAFLEGKNDPSSHLVASTGGLIYFNGDTKDRLKQEALARSYLAELKIYDNGKAVYRGGVLELNDKGRLQFLSGAESLKYDWDDIILDSATRANIQGSIDGFLNNYNREEWKRLGVPLSRGVLLDGPPGTGKSMVAKVLMSRIIKKAYAIKPTFIYVSARHVFSKDSIRSIYTVARKFSPAVVFIEDIDLIAGTNRENKQDIKNELMQQLSGVEELEGVISIATTNYANLIDPALRRSRRFGFQHTVGMPSHAERLALFKLFLKNLNAEALNFSDAANRSEGMTGADIKELCRIASEQALRSGSKSADKIIITDELMSYAFDFRKKTKKGGV